MSHPDFDPNFNPTLNLHRVPHPRHSFYHVSVVKEITQRYRCAQVRAKLVDALQRRVGYFNAIEVQRYLDEGNRELAA